MTWVGVLNSACLDQTKQNLTEVVHPKAMVIDLAHGNKIKMGIADPIEQTQLGCPEKAGAWRKFLRAPAFDCSN